MHRLVTSQWNPASWKTHHRTHFEGLKKRLGMSAAQLAADLGLRGADAIYVALAHQLKVPLITRDQEQLDRTRSVITAHQPT